MEAMGGRNDRIGRRDMACSKGQTRRLRSHRSGLGHVTGQESAGPDSWQYPCAAVRPLVFSVLGYRGRVIRSNCDATLHAPARERRLRGWTQVTLPEKG